MRATFVQKLEQEARENFSIKLMVGDLGYSVVDSFRDNLPNQFINAGIAEQNMMGMAAGMAMCGENVFVYSIGNFPTLRCLEQIRNDVCYHQANVKIISVGGGLAYGAQGYTHFCIEDFACLRAMPNMVVSAPADPKEAERITQLAIQTQGPMYIRLGKSKEPVLHQNMPDFKIGESIQVKNGDAATMIATGAILKETLDAAQILSECGIEVRVLSMPFIKPIDHQAILRAARDTGWLITVEEHSAFGGLHAAVCESLSEQDIQARTTRCALAEGHYHVGNREYLLAQAGLSANGIAEHVLRKSLNRMERL